MIDYYPTHWERRVTVYLSFSLKDRLKLLFGMPVDITVARRYGADYEPPLNSTVCDVRVRVWVNSTAINKGGSHG